MLTAGMMCNYGFMLDLPDQLLYKLKNKHKKGIIKTKLYLCDQKENELISRSIYGGRSMPRIHHYNSKDAMKKYVDIKDFLAFFDISGMYVYIMKSFEFPYGESRYATKTELEKYNKLIIDKNYDELRKCLPRFYIGEIDYQPNTNELEPSIERYEDKKINMGL